MYVCYTNSRSVVKLNRSTGYYKLTGVQFTNKIHFCHYSKYVYIVLVNVATIYVPT